MKRKVTAAFACNACTCVRAPLFGLPKIFRHAAALMDTVVKEKEELGTKLLRIADDEKGVGGVHLILLPFLLFGIIWLIIGAWLIQCGLLKEY